MLHNSAGEVGALPRPDDEDWCELLIAVYPTLDISDQSEQGLIYSFGEEGMQLP